MAAPALPRWKPDKDEKSDLDAMTTAAARIQRHTPKDAYFLEIPQEDGARYHHHHSQRHQWVRDAPFGRNEQESLQYQTFHLYEQGKELFEQHSTSLDSAITSRPGLVRAGPPSTGPKTKISLAAYKKKQNAATTTSELNAQKAGDAHSKQAAVKGPVERARAETEEMLAAIAESEQEVLVEKKGEAQVPAKDLKRKREEREQQETEAERKAETSTTEAGPAAKKPRPLPDQPVKRPAAQSTQRKSGAVASTKDDVVSGTSRSDEQRLPPRLSPQLSPLLPARLSPLPHPAAMSLPPRLSSAIPLNILKTLNAQKDRLSTSQPSLPPASSSASKGKSTTLTPTKQESEKLTKRKSPLPPRNGFRARSRSPTVREERSQPASQPRDDEILVAKAKTKVKAADSQTISPVLQKPNPRMVLKLKYRKSQASAIKRILGMRVAPAKSMLAAPSAEDPKSAAVGRMSGEFKDGAGSLKGVAQKVGPGKKEKKTEKVPIAEKRPPLKKEKPSISTPPNPAPAAKQPVADKQTTTEKRQLPEEERDESPAKRKKDDPSALRKDPSTPAQQDVESPSALKQATPSARNNLLAVAMARDKSQDSNSTQTPPGTVDTPSISSTSHPNGVARPPSSQSSNKNSRQQAWAAEARQYEKLGKELKHAATAHQNNKLPNSATSAIDQKLAAIKAIESFISFMLGFCCLDEVGQAADPRPHPPEIRTWQSLQGFQGFVKRNAEQFPALAGLTASLSSVFAARVLEIATQYHREDGITRDQIFDMQALLTKSATEASVKLDVDILQDTFPTSWNQRARSLPTREKLELGKLGGQYKLPIGLATTPVRAARAGLAILREWIEREKISYGLKLKL